MVLRQIRSTRRIISAAARREKSQQQDAPGIGAVDDQMGDPVGQRVGLAGTCARDDQQRQARTAALSPNPMFDGTALFGD